MVNRSKPTVAIFGGSFDPPHKAHQLIVEKAIEVLEIDHLVVVPAFLNPFKSSSVASATQRLEWVHTLFNNFKKVIVSDYEIKEGKSTTTQHTVKYFNKVYNVKYLIIGSDNLSTLTKWHNFSWLNQSITWVIATRSSYTLDISSLRDYKILKIDMPISSTQIREKNSLHFIDKQIQKSVHNVLKEITK